MQLTKTVCVVSLISVTLLSACVEQTVSPTPKVGSGLPGLALCDAGVCWADRPLALLTPEIVQEDIKRQPGYADAEPAELWSVDDVALHGWNPGDSKYIELVLRSGKPMVLARSLDNGAVLGQVINQFGDPSHILVQEYPNPERLLVSVQVIYASYGLLLHSEPTKGKGTYEVLPGLQVSAFTLSSARKLDELLASALYPLTSPPRISLEATGVDLAKSVQPWRGYGKYEVK